MQPIEVAKALGLPTGAPLTVLVDRPTALLVRVGDVVAKAHRPGTSAEQLAARLAVAADCPVTVSPLPVARPVVGPYVTRLGGRPVTLWPFGAAVDTQDPGAVPWQAAAVLLAELHARPLPSDVPVMGGYARLRRAFERLRTCERADRAATAAVLTAADGLPAWVTGVESPPAPKCLVHGDFHLGQLVSVGQAWQLIDVDDLGVGPGVWDLARPAAWAAVGLIPMDTWYEFLAAYHRAGGVAVPPDTDPWPFVEVAARAVAIQAAARVLTASARQNRRLDDDEELLIDACRRMSH